MDPRHVAQAEYIHNHKIFVLFSVLSSLLKFAAVL